MTGTLGIGIIGCGNISAAYFKLAPLFKGLEVRACTDLNMAAAEARAKEFGVKAQPIDDLLANPDVDVVINLTIPDAHYRRHLPRARGRQARLLRKALRALGRRGPEAQKARRRAGASRSAPRPTPSSAARTSSRASSIDDGELGTITAGTAYVMSHGMETWHPNPDFFFLPGAGPMLDVGPYYIANLINLIGPVKRVAALTNCATPTRTISTEGPRKGETSRSAPRPTSTRCSTSTAAQRHGRRELGRLGAPPPPRSSSTAPTARSSSPTPTGSAAPSSWPAATARSPRSPHGTIRSASRTTSGRAAATPTTAPPASPTWRWRSSKTATPAAAGPRPARHRRDDLDPEVRRDRRLRRAHHHLHPPRTARPRRGPRPARLRNAPP